MYRFADRILAGQVVPPVWLQPHLDARARSAMNAEVKGLLRSLPVLVVDRVTDYFYAGTDQEIWTHQVDFRRWLPPFTSFWMETVRPTGIRTTEPGEHRVENLPAYWGVHFDARRADLASQEILSRMQDPEERAEAVRRIRYRVDSAWARYGAGIIVKRARYGESFHQHLETEEASLIIEMGILAKLEKGEAPASLTGPPGAIAWAVNATLYVEETRGGPCGPCACWQFALGAEGERIVEPQFGLPSVMGNHGFNPDDWGGLNHLIHPMLLALCLVTAGGLKLASSARRRDGLRPYQVVVGDVAAAHARWQEALRG